ncbi:MAG: 4Fe-4S binding protein [Deltaproteobacteria bacterium]|nr:4Fe-4S binding protein [Deltaproteobacteria bacterium]
MAMQDVYKQLLDVMKKRGGGYSGMDIPEFYALVEELFTPGEAEVNNAMPRGPFAAKDLAGQMGRDEAEIEPILESMANKGVCMAVTMKGAQFYQSARFMPGILEFQFMPGKTTDRDKKIARLIHDYEKAFDSKISPRATAFPTTRVITVDKTVEAGNQVHTYDQVQTFIDKYEPIAVTACYCRHAASLRDEDIHGMPLDVCMQFGMGAQFAIERLGGRKLTKQEARDVLDRSEDAGLIHMSVNTSDDIGFICNCDRWHCVAVKNALSKPKPGLFFNSGFEPSFDAEACIACETCIDRCPPEALTMGDDDVPKVNLDLCFGCAVCATGCTEEAITMVNKPGFAAPPKNGKELVAAIKAGAAG